MTAPKCSAAAPRRESGRNRNATTHSLTQWATAASLGAPFEVLTPSSLLAQPAGTGGASNALTFERADWTLFRTLPGVCQKAGVSPDRLVRCVAKELVDNALDASGDAEVRWVPGHEGRGVFVHNSGKAIDGTDEEIASLFSIHRPLRSSKLLRLPTRGALGNGLRVVAGAVLATGGSLVVRTGKRSLRLEPQDDGATIVSRREPWEGDGTEIEAVLGDKAPVDLEAVAFAATALEFVGCESYGGRTCSTWYDSAAFFELTQASGAASVRALVESFEGYSGAKAGRVVGEIGLLNRAAASLTRAEAEGLRGRLVAGVTRKVRPERLGRIGRREAPGYAKYEGTIRESGTAIPVVIEVWAWILDDGAPDVRFFINRSPILARVVAWKESSELGISTCGLHADVKIGRVVPAAEINIQTPHMPITSDGKEPNLRIMGGAIVELLDKAIKGAKRASGATSEQISQKEIIIDALPRAIAKTSGDGAYDFSQRQLFYGTRSRPRE